ncbi:MAG: hypothetical protein ACTSYC_04330 [Promethearchaeota archaeon]
MIENDLKKLKELLFEVKKENIPEIQSIFNAFLKNYLKKSHFENYEGDYPVFIEPVYVSKNVKIGDDVLIGPNVFIGENTEIGAYDELSNSIILDNVKLGANFKLNRCLIDSHCKLEFNNINLKNCIIIGSAHSEEELRVIKFF